MFSIDVVSRIHEGRFVRTGCGLDIGGTTECHHRVSPQSVSGVSVALPGLVSTQTMCVGCIHSEKQSRPSPPNPARDQISLAFRNRILSFMYLKKTSFVPGRQTTTATTKPVLRRLVSLDSTPSPNADDTMFDVRCSEC